MAGENRQGLPIEVLKIVDANFFDDAECTRWWLDRCYPSGPRCPDCGASITHPQTLQSFHSLKRFTCPGCGRQPRATKGTILEGAHLSPRQLFLLCLLIGLNAPKTLIASTLDCALETVNSWSDRLAAELSA